MKTVVKKLFSIKLFFSTGICDGGVKTSYDSNVTTDGENSAERFKRQTKTIETVFQKLKTKTKQHH